MKTHSLLFFLLSLVALSAVAQEDTFESVKAQLGPQSLPLINLTVDMNQVSKPTYTNAVMEMVDPLRRTDPERATTTFSCMVKYRGGTSLAYDKKSFTVKLTDGQGESLDAKLFGIRKDDSWILNAMAFDCLRMRDRVNFDVWNAMSSVPYDTDYGRRNGTEGLFVELFINGCYQGLYCFSDKVNRKLLGIKKPQSDGAGNVTIRGVMYKGYLWSSATYLKGYKDDSMYEAAWNGWKLDCPNEHPCPEAYTPLKDFIDYCIRTSDKALEEGIDEWFYWQNFVDYHVLLLAEGLIDNQMKNTFLSIVNTQKGHRLMVTPWDMDRSLGRKGEETIELAKQENVLSVGLYYRLWKRDIRHYRAAVANRWRELYATVLSEESFNARLDAYAEAFTASGAWQREWRKWNGNPVVLHQDIGEEVAYVKDWYRRNCLHLTNDLFEGIASGVGEVDGPSADDAETVYDLMGQKVNAAYKGIVIKGGKKMLRR